MQSRNVVSEASVRLARSKKARDVLSGASGEAGQTITPAAIADILAECAVPGATLVVGVTGSVAAGKTTLCAAIASHLRSTQHIEIVSTDGFLLPNETLAARDLSLRKGFPEFYDAGLMSGTLQRARWGAVRIPGYSHKLYDRSPSLDRTINRPDILLVEGLGLSPGPHRRDPSSLLDILIYIDAAEPDLEAWFITRFMAFWREAETNSSSFYARFRSMTEAQAEDFSRSVWRGINLPNLRDHILPARDHADIVLAKTSDHALMLASMAGAANH